MQTPSVGVPLRAPQFGISLFSRREASPVEAAGRLFNDALLLEVASARPIGDTFRRAQQEVSVRRTESMVLSREGAELVNRGLEKLRRAEGQYNDASNTLDAAREAADRQRETARQQVAQKRQEAMAQLARLGEAHQGWVADVRQRATTTRQMIDMAQEHLRQYVGGHAMLPDQSGG